MSSSSPHNSFRYSAELLAAYSAAALSNAGDLIEEAQLLCDHGHRSRAYFLAVAAIEEVGKSFIAFDAQGRNLSDSAVTARIRSSFENHSNKINSAFHASISSHGDIRNGLQPIVELIIALKYGREPSMYTDIDYGTEKIKCPKDVVREVAAKDCIRLAKHCYYESKEHFATKVPAQRSAHDDAFFAMKSSKTMQLFNTEDFWWFHIANMESGKNDLSESVVVYQREYLGKGRLFKQDSASDGHT